MSGPRALLGGAAALSLAVALAACGSAATTTAGPDPAVDGSTAPASGTVTVLAAASLTDSFNALAADFEAAHPGITVEPSYGASSTLVQQVNNGAPADVVALAGQSAAAPLDANLVVSTDVFASNVLEIAVPPDNPGEVTGLGDLGRTGLKVVLCAASVPCGAAADATLAKAGVSASVVSRELDVKATLAKVRLGEADAAVVYRSDVVAAKESVRGIPVPEGVNTTLRYPIIALDHEAATTAFVDYVLSSAGAATVQSFGLGGVGCAVSWRSRLGLGLPALLALALLVLPLLALLLRADWARIPADLATPLALPALRLSLLTTSTTAVVCLALGTPLAWLLARSTHRATAWVRALVTVPLVLPPVVGGVALLLTWGRNGVIGGPLAPFGVRSPSRRSRSCSPRCSSRCRSTCSPSRARCAASTPGSSRSRAPSAPPTCATCAPSGCRSCCPGSPAGSRSRGPGRSASSARRSPSPAASPAAPRPRPSRSTPPSTRTRPWPPRSASCCSPRASSSSGCCAVGGCDDRVRGHGGARRANPVDPRPDRGRRLAHRRPGEVVAVLGPNGSGKTTAVLTLAGVLATRTGHVRVGGEPWAGPDRHLRPEQRSVGLMLADNLLFPHLRAVDNVAYGPRSRGVAREAARERALRRARAGRSR